LACDYFFFCYYCIIYTYQCCRGTLFFYFIIIFSRKTLPEHNANKVPSSEFYVREPNSTDPLSFSLSNYISLCRLIYFAVYVYMYVPTAAGPADTAPSALYLYIGTLIGHHNPGRYTGRNESKRIERRKKTADISDQFCFTTDINRRPLSSSRLLQKTERKKIIYIFCRYIYI